MGAILDIFQNFLTGNEYGAAIMDSITQWLSDKLAEVADSLTFEFVSQFEPSIDYFNELFPNAPSYYGTLISIGIILIVALFSFTMLFNLLGIVTGMEEKPLTVVGRTAIAIFMVIYSGEIMNYIFQMGMKIMDLINSVEREEGWATNVFQEFATAESEAVNSVVKLILFLIIIWKVLTLFLEIIERYLVMCLFWYLSPIANATFVTKATAKIFSTFYSGVFVQVLICSLNIWFLRMATDIITLQMVKLLSGELIDVLISGLIIIGWLDVAKKIDQYLKSLGFGVVQTGGNLGRSVTGAMFTIASMGRMASHSGLGKVSHGNTVMKDVFGRTHSTVGNKMVSNTSGLAEGVMRNSAQTVPNQDAFMSTDHRGKAAATIVGDAGRKVIANSNIAGFNSPSVQMGTLTAGAMQGEQFKFGVYTTDGDKVSGHISRLPEENGVQGIESVGESGEKQYTYFDKGSGLPTGTGLEQGQTSTIYDANKATATQSVNGEIDINSGAWSNNTMESIGFMDIREDSQITLMEQGHLEISDSSGEGLGTVLTSSHEGFDVAKGLGNYYQDPLTGNQVVGFPASRLDGLNLDADAFAKYQGVQDVIGSGAIPRGVETLETHGRQTYIRDTGSGRAMQYEIVTSNNLDLSKLNTYKKISLPNGGDVYCRSKMTTANSGQRKRKR